MEERKIIQILRSFSKPELKDFVKFTASPYMNEKRELHQLLVGLSGYAPAYNRDKIDYKAIFNRAFPGQDFCEKKLTKQLFYLAKLGEQFIVFESVKKRPMENNYTILHYFQSRKLSSLFLHKLKECRKWWENHPQPEAWDYNWYFMVEKEYANFIHRNQNHFKGTANLQEASDALDAYFLQEKLKLGTALINRQNIIDAEYQLPLLESIDTILEEDGERFVPIVQVWHKALKVTKDRHSRPYFESLKKLILERVDDIPANDANAILTLLQNAARPAIEDDMLYYKTMYELYQIQIEHNLLYQNGSLFPGLVNNIITISLKLGYLDWAEAFLEEHKNHIPKGYRENTYLYNLASIQFERKGYHDAMNILNRLNYKDTFLTLRIKRLQLKIYFELCEWELLDAAINTSRVFLHRLNKVSESHKNVNLAFVNQVSSIYKLQLSATKNDFQKECHKMLQSIENIPVLPERKWLMSKLQVGVS